MTVNLSQVSLDLESTVTSPVLSARGVKNVEKKMTLPVREVTLEIQKDNEKSLA